MGHNLHVSRRVGLFHQSDNCWIEADELHALIASWGGRVEGLSNFCGASDAMITPCGISYYIFATRKLFRVSTPPPNHAVLSGAVFSKARGPSCGGGGLMPSGVPLRNLSSSTDGG